MHSFLKAKDLEGPARVLFNNGVRGGDFAAITLDDLVADLRMSTLASRNVLQVREEFLRLPV